MTWNTDMSAAPRDGREVLVYRPDAGVFTAHFTESWAAGDYLERTGDPCWFTASGEDLTEDMPTHWMPLPQPPEPPNGE